MYEPANFFARIVPVMKSAAAGPLRISSRLDLSMRDGRQEQKDSRHAQTQQTFSYRFGNCPLSIDLHTTTTLFKIKAREAPSCRTGFAAREEYNLKIACIIFVRLEDPEKHPVHH